MSADYYLFLGICRSLFRISFILYKNDDEKIISTYHILGTSVSMSDKLISFGCCAVQTKQGSRASQFLGKSRRLMVIII